ncbi:MAG: sulfatase-like hydrolase/transferase [Geminicoccaceae bacterium]
MRCSTILLATLSFCLLGGGSQAAASGRSVLLVILDDFGMGEASFVPPGVHRLPTQPPPPPMPNLSRMAEVGMVFANVWVQPECSPTRAALITGQYGFRPTNGVGEWIDETRPSLPAAAFTLPEAFRASPAGSDYVLAHIGKWHLSRLSEGRQMPLAHGWPAYEGPISGGALSSYLGYYEYAAANGIVQPPRQTLAYATTEQVNDALAVIGEATAVARPYFVTLALNAPHSPYSKPPDELHHYAGLPTEAAPDRTLARTYYEAMIESIDTELGRLLDGIDLSTTTVIVVGDNGTPGMVTADPYPRSRAKSTLYEGGIRVPLLVFGAGVTGGTVVESIVAGVDLYPTILELAGIDPRQVVPAGNPLDGVSLVPFLTGAIGPTDQVHAHVYADKFAGQWNVDARRAIRNATFKLIDREGDADDQMFDLLIDPLETQNLLVAPLTPAAAAAEIELRTALAALLASRSGTRAPSPLPRD